MSTRLIGLFTKFYKALKFPCQATFWVSFYYFLLDTHLMIDINQGLTKKKFEGNFVRPKNVIIENLSSVLSGLYRNNSLILNSCAQGLSNKWIRPQEKKEKSSLNGLPIESFVVFEALSSKHHTAFLSGFCDSTIPKSHT